MENDDNDDDDEDNDMYSKLTESKMLMVDMDLYRACHWLHATIIFYRNFA